MELDHEFTIPVPVDRAWPVLLDVQRVAPCVPGATLDSVEGDEFVGRLKVKLGAMTITYRGSARILTADEATRTVTLEGSAKEARGTGTASVTVQAALEPAPAGDEAGEATRVTVHTKLNVTGRPAQFGRGLLSEVGGKLIARFAAALSEELAADRVPESPAPEPVAEPVPEAEAAPETESAAAPPVPEVEPKPVPEPTVAVDRAAEPVAGDRAETVPATVPARRSEDAIDLLEVAGPSVAKRVAPVAAGLIAALTIWRVFSRRRGRHHR